MSYRCLRRSPELGREEQIVTLVSDHSDLPGNVLHLPPEAGAGAEVAVRDLSTKGTDPWTTIWRV